MAAPRRSYDHRIRALVCEEDDPRLASVLGVPRSTAISWRRRGPRDVVTSELCSAEAAGLRSELVKVRRRERLLLAVCRLLFVLVRVLGARLDLRRLPEKGDKAKVLEAISRARNSIPLTVALRVVGMSAARYHAWRRVDPACLPDDRSSCPKAKPTQLSAKEIRVMHGMVADEKLRHMPMGVLALYAQRIKKVFASPTTWQRMARDRGWLRSRRRVHPERPTTGLRATAPNQYWHIDVTIVRLLDNSRVYLQAIIDNYSRRILSWRATPTLDPGATSDLLAEAALSLPADATATVVSDSGVENVNRKVDALCSRGQLKRVLAQVEVSFSNSMIEAWWRSLKHQWLFLHRLDSLEAVRRLVTFYVGQHNAVMPHSAFRGQTPNEVFLGKGDAVLEELAKARLEARTARLEANRAFRCSDCKAARGPPGRRAFPGIS